MILVVDFDVDIDNANIFGNIGTRLYIDCVFRCSQQMFLELCSTILSKKVQKVFKIVSVIPILFEMETSNSRHFL